MPRVSVIIPVYNGEKTIQKTVASVLNQTFSDFELLIVNNGSTDATSAIVAGFNDRRIRALSISRSSSARSRNYGITHACGEYLAFLDADDLWLQDKLREQLQALQEAPEAHLAYSWTDHIDEDGNFLYPGTHACFSGHVYQQLLVYDFIESGSNVLLKQEALRGCGGFDESLGTAEDWDLWLRLARSYAVTVVPRVQVLYRHSADSKSFRLSAHKKAIFTVIEHNYAQAPASLRYVRKDTYAHAWLYLWCKAIEQFFMRHRCCRPCMRLWYRCNNSPSLRAGARRTIISLLRFVRR